MAAVLALVIMQNLLLIVIAVMQLQSSEHLTWLKSVLLPWIVAINNKLGLPK